MSSISISSIVSLPTTHPITVLTGSWSPRAYTDPANIVGFMTRAARTMLDTSDAYSVFGRSIAGHIALRSLQDTASNRTAAQTGQIIGATVLGIGPALATRVVAKAGEVAGIAIGSVIGTVAGTIAVVVSKIMGGSNFSLSDALKIGAEVYMSSIYIFRDLAGYVAGVYMNFITECAMAVGAAFGWLVGKAFDAYRVRQLNANS